MPNINNIEIVAKRKLPVFFVVDCSDSMRYSIDIEKLKDIIIEIVNDINDSVGSDYDIFIGLLTYGTNVNWIGDGLVSVRDFFVDIPDFDGLSDIGNAFDELSKRLSRRAFLKDVDSRLYMKPIIVFIGDGCSTDDYSEQLKKLEANKLFKNSIKICVLTGNVQDLFFEITKSREAIVNANELYNITRMIMIDVDRSIDEDDFNVSEKNDIDETMKTKVDVDDSW